MSQTDAVHVVYEDEEIRVLYRMGRSRFLLITFGDLISPAHDLRFFADTPARKADIACIGFMAKRGNWYPSRNMAPVTLAVNNVMGHYEKRITYGGSMGGYAAVKYTAALKATHAISLCPQWSLDREECGGVDPGWQQFYSPALQGMGIKAEDVSGKVYVFSDLYDRTDRFHADKIKALSGNVKIINVPRIGHDVTTMMAGTDNLLGLIDACLNDSEGQIRALCSAVRRGYEPRSMRLLDFFQSRYPALLDKRVCQAHERGSELVEKRPGLVYRALAHCVKIRDTKRALSIVNQHAIHTKNVEKYWQSVNFLAHHLSVSYVIRTFHDSVLCYSHEDDAIAHTLTRAPSFAPVRMVVNGHSAFLFVSFYDCTLYFHLQEGRLVSTTNSDEGTMMVIRYEGGSLFSLAVGGKFVCAANPLRSVGRVSVESDKVDGWERFYFDLYGEDHWQS